MFFHDLLASVGVPGGVTIALTLQDPLPMWQLTLGSEETASRVPGIFGLINTFPISPSQ